MLTQDNETKNRILGLINECRTIINEWRPTLYVTEGWKKFSEEDTKLKLIFPLFEILGWNIRDHKETEVECGEYDERIQQILEKKWPHARKQGVKIDCIFKTGNQPYICLQAKHLAQRILPSLEYLEGQRTVAYAQKWGAKYVVFTNFLKMLIYKIEKEPSEPTELEKFEKMNEYISKYDKLKVLMKPKS